MGRPESPTSTYFVVVGKGVLLIGAAVLSALRAPVLASGDSKTDIVEDRDIRPPMLTRSWPMPSESFAPLEG